MTSRTRAKQLAPIEGEKEVREVLNLVAKASSVRQAAEKFGVSAAMLSRVLRGEAQVSTKLAKAAGYRKVIRFEIEKGRVELLRPDHA